MRRPTKRNPLSSTTYTTFLEVARLCGPERAISDGDAEYSFDQLIPISRDLAKALMAAGIAKGDRVGIWSNNRAEWILAALGIQAAGGTLVPLSTRLRGPEVSDILRRSRAKLLFSDAGFGAYDFIQTVRSLDLPDLARIVNIDAQQLGSGVVWSWQQFAQSGTAITDAQLDARIASIKPEDFVDILYTSGTTGQPKGVPMAHYQSLISTRITQSEVALFERGDRFIVLFPFAHVAGYRAGWQTALLHGVRVVILRHYDVRSLLELIKRDRPTYFPAAPTIYFDILDYPHRREYDLSCIRIAITGGTDVPVELIRRMRSELGVGNVMTGYGMTETAGSVSSCRLGDDDEVVAKTAGRVHSNLQVICLDENQKPVLVGTPGEIAVRGRQVFSGYFEDAAASAAAFTSDGYFRTGDIGVFDERGNLSITGRLKDMYLVGGFNCYPAEIERRMRELAGVADIAVVGIPDERLGQVGRAFIVKAPGTALTPESIVAWCKEAMANYKVPRSIVFVDELPRNSQGKVLKAPLREYQGPVHFGDK